MLPGIPLPRKCQSAGGTLMARHTVGEIYLVTHPFAKQEEDEVELSLGDHVVPPPATPAPSAPHTLTHHPTHAAHPAQPGWPRR